jgi:hypothetical protein
MPIEMLGEMGTLIASELLDVLHLRPQLAGMIAKFHKNYEQFSKECKKKSFLKAMEEVERFRVGTFPGAPRPRQPDAKKPAAKKDEKERPKKKQKVEQKRSESDTSSSRFRHPQPHFPCPLRRISAGWRNITYASDIC